MIQQQLLSQSQNKYTGRICFLATSILNMLIFALAFYKITFDSLSKYPLFIQILLGYFTIHNVFGVICVIDADPALIKGYRISSYIVLGLDSICVVVGFLGVIYFYYSDNSASVGDQLIFLFCCAALIISIIETIICFFNIKYIKQLLKINQSLGFTYPQQFNHPQLFTHNQPQVTMSSITPQHFIQPQGYFIQHPTQNQMFEQKQQFTQPITNESISGSTYQQPFILQNGYNQFQ